MCDSAARSRKKQRPECGGREPNGDGPRFVGRGNGGISPGVATTILCGNVKVAIPGRWGSSRNGVKKHGTLFAKGFYKVEPKRAPHTQGGNDVPESRNTTFGPVLCDCNLGARAKNYISQTRHSSAKNGRVQSISF